MDNVNHPKHYTNGRVECIDAIASAVAGKEPLEAVYVANVIKYLWRYEAKNGLEDVRKAKWYLDRLAAHLERRTPQRDREDVGGCRCRCAGNAKGLTFHDEIFAANNV